MEKSQYVTEAELRNAPTISIGGRTFHIPRLALAQNRVVVDNLTSILPVIGKMEAIALSANPAGELTKAMATSFPIDMATFNKMCDAVYAAITRGYPDFTRDEFDNGLPVAVDEIVTALPIVMSQSFAFKKKEASRGNGIAGETLPAPSIDQKTVPDLPA